MKRQPELHTTLPLGSPEKVREHLENILDYLWDDEHKDYWSHFFDGYETTPHIFKSLVFIRQWLDGEPADGCPT